MYKKALSPLIATILLVVFALIIGTATMSWGQRYVEGAPIEEEPESYGTSLVINLDQIDNPLKEIQIKYITDKLTLDEYLEKEQSALLEMENS